MHVYSLSLGRETEKRKESLAVLLALALSQLLCSLFVPSNIGRSSEWTFCLRWIPFQIPPYLNTSFTRLTQHTWRQVQALFLPSLPSPLLGKSYISAEKKCTHPVLIRPGKGAGSGRADPIEAPHMSLDEQNRTGRRAGMPRRFIWLLFLAFDDTV